VVEDATAKLLRVQVKSTRSMKHKGYAVRSRGSQGAYPADAYDYLAAYVILEGVWYIIPEEFIRGKTTISIVMAKGRYAKYRETWELLSGKTEEPESVIAGN